MSSISDSSSLSEEDDASDVSAAGDQTLTCTSRPLNSAGSKLEAREALFSMGGASVAEAASLSLSDQNELDCLLPNLFVRRLDILDRP